jgi:hypothetical protein
MSQITVWKCDQTGKLFEDKNKYKGHLSKLARERNTRRKLTVAEAVADQKWNELYECEQTIEQWKLMVLGNQDMFWAEAARSDPVDWKYVGKTHGRSKNGVVCPVPRLLEFERFDVRWNPNVSNSHSCPHNGVQNWGGREQIDGQPAPTGYPGWSGRVDWIVAWPKEWDGVYLGGDLFRGLHGFRSGRQRAHTGSGGGGGARYSEKHGCYVQSFGYDFKLFAADWPGMARVVGMNQLEEILRGERLHLDYAPA